jgi:lysophospholipase L1-like esterase
MARTPSRFWLWTLPLTVGAAAAAVLAAGLFFALRGSVGAPLSAVPAPATTPAPRRAPDGTARILVLGDSLARGTGDESGKGFAVDVLEAFRKRGKAELTNLGVNGLESGEIRTTAESSNVRSLAADANLILVSAGGNDLSHAAAGVARSPSAVADAVAAARRDYAGNLRAILSTLREANPSAPIGVLGLYDPFGGGPQADSGPGRLGASVILQWNAIAAETALSYPGVFVIPTFDLFQGRADRLSADRYHPNRKGYEEIAKRILQALPS